MSLFHPDNATLSDRHNTVYARFEFARTVVDFLAAFCFVAGSILYFYPSLTTGGTWLFLIGSILFALKPTIKLCREIALRRMDVRAELPRP
ncbi:YrhK family protein [Acuticoccus mangrovi]|uniref:YrhK family protein n=1 Tax=Acuticoccus mangrovi TaxID=2796142 RepID=A0A934ITM1_9HYPH|nr:YrhK family protein [Acuticoccus mangrovi]MBJ3777474.1 YrhK family protein [Acuticoccus mangrovi]